MPNSRKSSRKETSGKPPIPADEFQRLQALLDLDILNGNPEAAFDRITLIAKTLLQVRVCAMSPIDADRQHFKSIAGLSWPGTPRDVAFCAHTILTENALVVPDATLDLRFQNNPLVTGSPGIRFYAGVPLNTREGSKIGALCVIDTKPRYDWSDMRSAMLRELARMVCHELEIRSLQKRNRELEEQNHELL